jgi:flagellar biosynthesis protein FlhF
MHYKKFYRPTVREALRAVREELGPTALVLSTRMVASPGVRGWIGGRGVEVTAAVDRDQVSTARITPSASRLDQRSRSIAAQLTASGLSESVATAVAKHPALHARGAGAQTLRDAVADTLAPLTAPEGDFAAVEVFVGPPGVGKTTTIAKIAAQERAARAARLGLVAADGFRVGAVEQLRLYADIIGSPFAVARSGAELTRAIDRLDGPVLVDTAGRSPKDEGIAEILDVLSKRTGIRRHLVMPATTPAAQAKRIIERFAPTHPDRLVLTRLDEIDTLAPLVDVLTDSALPVSYLATGQSVPDALERATPEVFTSWVLGDATEGARA